VGAVEMITDYDDDDDDDNDDSLLKWICLRFVLTHLGQIR